MSDKTSLRELIDQLTSLAHSINSHAQVKGDVFDHWGDDVVAIRDMLVARSEAQGEIPRGHVMVGPKGMIRFGLGHFDYAVTGAAQDLAAALDGRTPPADRAPGEVGESDPFKRIPGLHGIADAADYLARNPGDEYATRRLRERLDAFAEMHGLAARAPSAQGDAVSKDSPFYLEPLPERDPSKPNAEQGLYRKFDVRRTDGSDQPGGKHHGCEYFVLDVSHDRAAPYALAAYAEAIKATHPDLARDLIDRYDLALYTSAPAAGDGDS